MGLSGKPTKVRMRNFGAGAVEINWEGGRILVDAIHPWAKGVELTEGDLLVATHNDQDHFVAESLPDIRGRNIRIVGPATVFHDVMAAGKADPEQITVLHSPDRDNPASAEFGDLKVECFHSEHFLGWRQVHNSYLLTLGDFRLFVTGDAYLDKEAFGELGPLDLVLCNLVEKGFITRAEDPRFARFHLLSYLCRVKADYNPRYVCAVHLLDFDGSPEPAEIDGLAQQAGFDWVLTPRSTEDVLTVS